MVSVNPWAVVVGVSVCVACYVAGRHDGAKIEDAAQAREERATQVAYGSAQKAAAEAIAKLEVKHVTYKQQIEREVREVPVYRDCRHSDDGMRAINAALANGAVAPGSGELSVDAWSIGRRFVWSDSGKIGGGVRGVLQVPGGGFGR